MDKRELILSIAYCSLVCRLCHLTDECDGCRAAGNRCPANSERERGCYHRNCCVNKGIDGCWECDDFPCKNQMFVGPTKGEIKGFCRCIKEDGARKFIEYILANQKKGIPYGRKGYGDKDENEVIRILRKSVL